MIFYKLYSFLDKESTTWRWPNQESPKHVAEWKTIPDLVAFDLLLFITEKPTLAVLLSLFKGCLSWTNFYYFKSVTHNNHSNRQSCFVTIYELRDFILHRELKFIANFRPELILVLFLSFVYSVFANPAYFWRNKELHLQPISKLV